MAAKPKRKKAQKKKSSSAGAKTRKSPSAKGLTKRSKKKKTTKKKAMKKKRTLQKTGKQASQKKASVLIAAKEPVTIKPGPPGLSVPPVEEPAVNEEAIGTVTHYYSHLAVAIVQINKGTLRTGDRIRMRGNTTDFTQTIGSMEYEHQQVDQVTPGQTVGLKVVDHARQHDILYKLR